MNHDQEDILKFLLHMEYHFYYNQEMEINKKINVYKHQLEDLLILNLQVLDISKF